MEKTALIIIDIQNDYFPNGLMELEEPVAAAENARKALMFFRDKGKPLYHIRHENLQPDAPFFLPETYGNQIHELVEPLPHEPVIMKHFPNSFRATELLEKLKEQDIEKLVIVGMMTLMCVDATVRAAFDLGFECTVLHDATAATTLQFEGETIPAAHVHGTFLAALAMGYAQVVSTDAFLAR
ncbi:MAG: cysteine hydrolase [bacterium]|nr:cysteine hydrolase [bacterium]